MFEFTGDWDNLEGRVFIWSRALNEKENPIRAVLFTNDPFDVIGGDFEGDPKANANELERVMKENARAMMQRQGIPDVPIWVLYVKDITLSSEDEIPDIRERLHVDDLSSIGACKLANSGAMAIYQSRYMEQLVKHLVVAHKISPEDDFNLTYTDFMEDGRRKPIIDYVVTDYINPMKESLRDGDRERYNSIKWRFHQFAKGSLLINDVIEVCGVLEKNPTNPKEELLLRYVNKMNAIHLERYEDAAKLRDQIREMKA